MNVAAILHHPGEFARRSGLFPLVEALGATPVFYQEYWRQWQKRSWTLGQKLREWGNHYYGSTWNALVPGWSEWQLRRQLPAGLDILHFLWGEFASPRRRGPFHRKAKAVVGSFHASARRQPQVLKGFQSLPAYDWITLMSDSQRPYFEAQGFPAGRIRVLLHGVDTGFYVPAPRPPVEAGRPLRGLMVGSTERDHAFMAQLLRRLPAGLLRMTILTAYDQRVLNYPDPQVAEFPQFLNDQQLLALYQQADLLIMPMLDCTANNAVLEALACGTPVLTHRVGGMPEYVDPRGSFLLEEKRLDVWADLLVHLAGRRDELEARRAMARAGVLDLDWARVAERYHAFYREVRAEQGR